MVKELREHGLVLVCLFWGFLATVVLALFSNQMSTFSVSKLEVVRMEVIWILPLVAFILGNILVVREYLERTRLFVEALPVRSGMLFLFKYLFGLFYLVLLVVVCVLITVLAARTSDIIDQRFVVLILSRSLAIVLLVWSIVFCLSLCGKLRLTLYFLLVGSILLAVWSPSVDHLRLGPMALLDADLFAFERYDFPWRDLAETVALSLVFLLVAWLLISLNEGSVAEMLAKPLSRRDYVALGVLTMGALTILGTLAENRQPPPDVFTGSTVVSTQEPPVSILYVDGYKDAADELLTDLVAAVDALQLELGMATVPPIRISLDPAREPDDIDYRGVSGVLVTANFADADAYQLSTLRSVVLHQVMQAVTRRRAQFEPWHWLLDGVSRWLAEEKVAQPSYENQSELLARSVYVERLLPLEADLARHWQVLAEKHGYAATEALAYSMVVFLLETLGEETLQGLAQSHLAVRSARNALVSVQAQLHPFTRRFREITGQNWSDFHRLWRRWLQDQGLQPDIAARLNQLPSLTGFVNLRDVNSAPVIEAGYRPTGDTRSPPTGKCVLRHRSLMPFDVEVEPARRDADEQTCRFDEIVHVLAGQYGYGDRVLLVLEYKSDAFHEPVRLHAERVDIR